MSTRVLSSLLWTCLALAAFALVPLATRADGIAARSTIIVDSGSNSLFSDPWGKTLLTSGQSNNEGALVEVGYYSSATVGNDFAGTWTPLGLGRLSIGSSPSGAAGPGTIAVSVTVPSTVTGPPAGTPLAIRFYSQPTAAASYTYNAVSSDDWLWQPQAVPPLDPVIILSLNNPNLNWIGGQASAFKTSVLISGTGFVPAPYQAFITDGTAGHDGFLQVTVGASGAFTGSLSFEGATYRLANSLAVSGIWSGPVPGGTKKRLNLSFAIQAASLTGTLTSGTALTLDAEQVNGGVNAGANGIPSPLGGPYTVILQQTAGPSSLAEYGYGLLTINGTTGGSSMTGELPDGTAYSVRTTMLANGTLLLNLPSHKGRLTGAVVIRDTPGVSDADGALHSPLPAGAYSPANSVYVLGSQYSTGTLLGTGTATSVISTLDFYANGLTSAVITSGTLGATGGEFRLIGTPSAVAPVVLTSTNGLFKGTVTPLKGKSHVPFVGVLFQKQQMGTARLNGGVSGYSVMRPSP